MTSAELHEEAPATTPDSLIAATTPFTRAYARPFVLPARSASHPPNVVLPSLLPRVDRLLTRWLAVERGVDILHDPARSDCSCL